MEQYKLFPMKFDNYYYTTTNVLCMFDYEASKELSFIVDLSQTDEEFSNIYKSISEGEQVFLYDLEKYGYKIVNSEKFDELYGSIANVEVAKTTDNQIEFKLTDIEYITLISGKLKDNTYYAEESTEYILYPDSDVFYTINATGNIYDKVAAYIGMKLKELGYTETIKLQCHLASAPKNITVKILSDHIKAYDNDTFEYILICIAQFIDKSEIEHLKKIIYSKSIQTKIEYTFDFFEKHIPIPLMVTDFIFENKKPDPMSQISDTFEKMLTGLDNMDSLESMLGDDFKPDEDLNDDLPEDDLFKPGNIRLSYLKKRKKQFMDYVNALPKEISLVIKDSIPMYQRAMAGEKNNLKLHLEALLNFPWYEKWELTSTLKDISDELDKTHKGLDEVKHKILSQVAILISTNKPLKQSLCLVGAPGVGKTSIALSLSKALNRPSYKISMSGQSQEVLIRGMNKAYLSAKYGQIVKALLRSKVNNPIIILDEIDKVGEGGGNSGSAKDALLEILDPTQNTLFRDNYLDVETDISNVMWICTANNLHDIPEPLISRLTIINLDSYLPNEKVEITRSHLLSEIKEDTNVDLDISDDVLYYIIEEYTREGGVRTLKQKLTEIASAIVLDQLKGNDTPSKVDVELVDKYLRVSEAVTVKNRKHTTPGIMNGLYYSTAGGGTMKIYVTPKYSKAKDNESGKVTIKATGNLKKVIEESTRVALNYVQTYMLPTTNKLKLDQNIEFNIHFQNGATPKDGPSAGGAIAMALISAWSKEIINEEYAMTGEITPVGEITAIGGLREKLYGAVDSGCKTVFVPKENQKYVETQIDPKITSKLKIHFVENIKEVIDVIFPNI